MYTPSHEELNKGLKALGYEIDQMCEAYRLCKDVQADVQGRKNTYLESFLLHVRILWDFYTKELYIKKFSTKKKHTGCREKHTIDKDTMLCSHYCIRSDELASIKDPTPLKINLDEKEINYKRHLNKRLAHLTYSRALFDYSHKDWPVREMFTQLTKLCIEFCELLVERYEFDGQTRETKEETWYTRKAKLERLKKVSKELPPGGYMSTNSIATEIQVDRSG